MDDIHGIHAQHFFRGIAGDLRCRGIQIEEPFLIMNGDGGDGSLSHGAEFVLTFADGVLIASRFDGAGDLLRDEHQNFFFVLPVTHILAIRLHHQGAESGVAALQRHTHPVERGSTQPLELAAADELV